MDGWWQRRQAGARNRAKSVDVLAAMFFAIGSRWGVVDQQQPKCRLVWQNDACQFACCWAGLHSRHSHSLKHALTWASVHLTLCLDRHRAITRWVVGGGGEGVEGSRGLQGCVGGGLGAALSDGGWERAGRGSPTVSWCNAAWAGPARGRSAVALPARCCLCVPLPLVLCRPAAVCSSSSSIVPRSRPRNQGQAV